MSTSPIGYPRTRAVLLTMALAASLLAAGCSYKPYPPPGKNFQGAAQQSALPQPEQAPQSSPQTARIVAPEIQSMAAPEAAADSSAAPPPLATAAAPETTASETAAARAPTISRGAPSKAEPTQSGGFLDALLSHAGPAKTPAVQPPRVASDETSAAQQLRFAAGRGEAQTTARRTAQPTQPMVSPQSSEVADPPMPSPPLGKAAAAQTPRDDKPAEPARTEQAPEQTAQKPQPETTAPAEPLPAPAAEPTPIRQAAVQATTAPATTAPATTAPKVTARGATAPAIAVPAAAVLVAAMPSAVVLKPVAPAAPIAPKVAPEASPTSAEPTVASAEQESLKERAADLFLEPEPAPEPSPAPQLEAKPETDPEEPAAETPAAAVAQPADPYAYLWADPATPAEPASAAAAPAGETRPAPEAPAPEATASATAVPTAPAEASELPEVSVSEVPLKLPPQSQSSADPETAEALTSAAEVSPAAGSGSNTTPEVEIAQPTGQTRVLFDEGTAVLTKEAQTELAKLASQIPDPAQFRITILGYGDGGSQSADAGRARVLALSRVMAVRQFLMVRGLPAERLAARAMGNQMTDGPASRVDVMVSQL